mgnify:CR=1 FL=1|jgi:TolA-binding protein|tara:strand:- start:19 stop:213 length:195 start_codon:yes stop_codon:yes gene_type:complete
MPMKIEISHLITVLTVTAVLGGFYYTTQYRLDGLEDQVTDMRSKIDSLEGKLNVLQRQVRKIKR